MLQRVFQDHFRRFAAEYDARYAQELGNFRIERIARGATRFLTCGDYRQGLARIRCSNPECRQEYFRPFSCKGFYLCPSCSQKRTLLFAEYLDERLLIADFCANAVAKVKPNAKVTWIAQSTDSDGLKGEMNQPEEPCNNADLDSMSHSNTA